MRIKDILKNEISRDTIIIDAENVKNYYWESDKNNYTIKDFPNISPPFEDFFIDLGTSKYKEGNVSIEIMSSFHCIESFKEGSNLKMGFKICTMSNTEPRSMFLTPGELIIKDRDVCFMRLFNSVPLSENIQNINTVNKINKMSQEDRQDLIKNALHMGMLTISFMNCKNTTLIENNPCDNLTRQQKRMMERKNIEPEKKYYILDIEPMKKILRKEGNIEENGFKKALHICRGHFRDYSKGNGLFGKFKGLYWVDMHTKGNKANGEIIKDYNILV